jgi:hypothetical protein
LHTPAEDFGGVIRAGLGELVAFHADHIDACHINVSSLERTFS